MSNTRTYSNCNDRGDVYRVLEKYAHCIHLGGKDAAGRMRPSHLETIVNNIANLPIRHYDAANKRYVKTTVGCVKSKQQIKRDLLRIRAKHSK